MPVQQREMPQVKGVRDLACKYEGAPSQDPTNWSLRAGEEQRDTNKPPQAYPGRVSKPLAIADGGDKDQEGRKPKPPEIAANLRQGLRHFNQCQNAAHKERVSVGEEIVIGAYG